MAGIGFELLKLWKQGSYQSLIRAYSLTALMGAGPGLFIILSLSVICFFSLFALPDNLISYQFLTAVVYLLSSSMIISAILQYTFFRFMADMIFTKEFSQISPNFIGVLLVQLAISNLIALPIVFYFFAHYSLALKIILISNFNVLCLIWVSIVLLTGFKAYRFIIWGFALGYFIMIIVHFLWLRNELLSLLFEFLLAQVILFAFLLYAILDYYPTKVCIKFDFMKRENVYYTLIFSNFFYAIGFWIDKYLFWFNSDTGFLILPPLRLSPIYDLPMFISYLTIIPATAVFLLHIEADFSFIYPQYMQTIFRRKTLNEINAIRNELIASGRVSVFSLFKTQSAVIIIMFLFANYLFSVLHILPVYLNILFILLVAVGLNIILWGLLNILYYMTQYLHALYVCMVFFICNLVFTWISLYAGPYYYGYGLGFSLILAIASALYFLNENFKNLEYSTFMLTD